VVTKAEVVYSPVIYSGYYVLPGVTLLEKVCLLLKIEQDSDLPQFVTTYSGTHHGASTSDTWTGSVPHHGVPIATHPFVLVKKQKQVHICRGCNSKFAPAMNNPPGNLVVRMTELYSYNTLGGHGAQSQSVGNRYYHAAPNCLRDCIPAFDLSKLILKFDLLVTDAQKRKLIENGFCPGVLSQIM
jgi:hypothetical protein